MKPSPGARCGRQRGGRARSSRERSTARPRPGPPSPPLTCGGRGGGGRGGPQGQDSDVPDTPPPGLGAGPGKPLPRHSRGSVAARLPERGSQWQAFEHLGEPEGQRDGSVQSDPGFRPSAFLLLLLSPAPSEAGPSPQVGSPGGRRPGEGPRAGGTEPPPGFWPPPSSAPGSYRGWRLPRRLLPTPRGRLEVPSA